MAFGDGLLCEHEEPPLVDVAQVRVARHSPRTPDTDAAAGKRADAVHAHGVQDFLLAVGDGVFEADRSADYLVRRGLVHTALGIVPGIDAGDVA